jgi:phage tail sheath gpL-like
MSLLLLFSSPASSPVAATGGISFSDVPDGDYAKAVGSITVDTNPSAGETLTVNGVMFSFRAISGGSFILIGADASETATNIQAKLAASVNPLLTGATYVDDTHGVVNITYNTYGASGNAFTLTTDSGHLTLSGATLSGGAGNFITVGSLVVTFYDSEGGGETPPDPKIDLKGANVPVIESNVTSVINDHVDDAQASAVDNMDGTVSLEALEAGSAGNSIPLSTTATNTTVTPFTGGAG